MSSTPQLPQNVSQKVQNTVLLSSYWLSSFVEGASRILLPLYFHSLGVKASSIALMFFIYEAFGFLTNMLSGFLLNRWGYRRTFILALLLHTLASVGYMMLAEGQALWVAILLVNLLRALRGMGKELLKTSSSAYIKQLHVNHLWKQALLGGKDASKGIGLLLGGLCLTSFGFKGSFLGLGVITIVCLIGALGLLQDYREVKQVSYKGFWDISPSLRQLALVRAFLYAGRDFWLVLALPLYLSSQGVSKVKVGLVLALGLVSFGVLQPVVGWWIKKAFVARGHVFKRPWLYEDVVPFATAALMLVPVAMIFLKDSLIAVSVLVVVYNLLSALSTAPHNDLHLRFAKEERASMDIACYKSIAQLGKVLAVMASGLVYQWAGLEGCLTASAICLAFAVIMGIPMTLRSRQSPQAQRFIAKYVMKL